MQRTESRTFQRTGMYLRAKQKSPRTLCLVFPRHGRRLRKGVEHLVRVWFPSRFQVLRPRRVTADSLLLSLIEGVPTRATHEIVAAAKRALERDLQVVAAEATLQTCRWWMKEMRRRRRTTRKVLVIASSHF